MAGRARVTPLPSVQVWLAVGTETTGAAMTLAEKVSETDSPLVSVAVTVIPIVCAATGATPEKLSVAALKLSHAGSA